eukprot:2918132-Rhodomonas_salina.2
MVVTLTPDTGGAAAWYKCTLSQDRILLVQLYSVSWLKCRTLPGTCVLGLGTTRYKCTRPQYWTWRKGTRSQYRTLRTGAQECGTRVLGLSTGHSVGRA